MADPQFGWSVALDSRERHRFLAAALGFAARFRFLGPWVRLGLVEPRRRLAHLGFVFLPRVAPQGCFAKFDEPAAHRRPLGRSFRHHRHGRATRCAQRPASAHRHGRERTCHVQARHHRHLAADQRQAHAPLPVRDRVSLAPSRLVRRPVCNVVGHEGWDASAQGVPRMRKRHAPCAPPLFAPGAPGPCVPFRSHPA